MDKIPGIRLSDERRELDRITILYDCKTGEVDLVETDISVDIIYAALSSLLSYLEATRAAIAFSKLVEELADGADAE